MWGRAGADSLVVRAHVPLGAAMTRRRYLTAKTKIQVWNHQSGCCAICGCWHDPFYMAYDHILPLCLGGTNERPNWQALCKTCHAVKTKREAGMRAKADRQRKAREGVKKRRGRAMSSRPFDTRLRRRVDGRVEVRT